MPRPAACCYVPDTDMEATVLPLMPEMTSGRHEIESMGCNTTQESRLRIGRPTSVTSTRMVPGYPHQ